MVRLTDDERAELEGLTTKGKSPAYRVNHARILLKADINQITGGWTDQAISHALDISVATIERVRQRFVEHGLAAALSRQTPTRTRPRLLIGEQEAHLIALACAQTPEGQAKWSVQLLADQMVKLGYVEQISHETVRQVLKKTS